LGGACVGGGAMLSRRINYVWRLTMTGIAFVEMGLGALILALAVIPVMTGFTRDRAARLRRAQRIIRTSFRLYVALLRRCGVITLQVIGEEKLSDCAGALVVANHPTLLDVVLLMSLVPDAQCVVKHQLWRNPFLRPVVKAAGYIRNDRDPESFVEECRASLHTGRNLIIFPEGTRSVPGRPIHFQRGFAHLATLIGSNLQPILITCDPVTLVKGQPWYSIPQRLPAYRIKIEDQIEIRAFLTDQPRSLAARRLVAYLEARYRGELAHA